MDKKINWKLEGNGNCFNLFADGIKLPTLDDYEQYIKIILSERDEKLIGDGSVDMGDSFLLYSEELSHKIVTFFWRNQPVIVDANNLEEIFRKLKETEKSLSNKAIKTENSYINTLKESIEELRI